MGQGSWGPTSEFGYHGPAQIAAHPGHHHGKASPPINPNEHTPPPPRYDVRFITFKGHGTHRNDIFSALCGDQPPIITDGYAKWTTIDRPLYRGVTVFQGYNPTKMTVDLRFGTWDGMCGARKLAADKVIQQGWGTDNETSGVAVESDIERLEWMAGSNFPSGAPPMVYVNTWGSEGASTNLVPYEYQHTTDAPQWASDTALWPWVITSLSWGKSVRAPGGNRIYQEVTVELTNFQSLTKPPKQQKAGHYFTTTPTTRSMVKIANAQNPPPLDPEGAAKAIQKAHKNNPMHHSSIHLSAHGLKWKIPPGKVVWVPAYNF